MVEVDENPTSKVEEEICLEVEELVQQIQVKEAGTKTQVKINLKFNVIIKKIILLQVICKV